MPTRYYLTNVASPVAGAPSATASAQVDSGHIADAGTCLVMGQAKGDAVHDINFHSLTAPHPGSPESFDLMRLYLGPALAAQVIPAGTSFTLAGGFNGGGGADNWWLWGFAYLWRPGVGYVATLAGDGTSLNGTLGGKEGLLEDPCLWRQVAFAPLTVPITVLAGDRVVVEAWGRFYDAAPCAGHALHWVYGGIDDSYADGDSLVGGDAAAYLESSTILAEGETTMADRPLALQVARLGVESSAGVAVPATLQLQSLGIEVGLNAETNRFGPVGTLYDTMVVPGKVWGKGRISGPQNYNELVYPLSSLLCYAAPASLGSGAYQWVFSPRHDVAGNVKTFTVERGQGGGDAEQMAYTAVNSLTMAWNRNECTCEGDLIGAKPTTGFSLTAGANEVQTISMGGASGGHFHLTFDGVTTADLAYNITAADLQTALRGLSTIGAGNVNVAAVAGGYTVTFVGDLAATPVPLFIVTDSTTGGTGVVVTETTAGGFSTVPEKPVLPTQLALYMDPTYAALGTTKMERDFSAELSIADRWEPLWPVDSAVASFDALVPKKPTMGFKLQMEADSQGVAPYANLAAGSTIFTRLEAVGDTIGGGITYRMRVDMALKVLGGDFGSGQEVLVIDWDCAIVWDSGSARGLRIEIINTVDDL